MANNYELQKYFFNDWSLDLYMTEDGGPGLGYLDTFPDRKKAIMEELGVRSEDEILSALCRPEFSAPMFDIITWFNRKYIEIKSEAASIPPIRLQIVNPMTHELETVTFKYYRQVDEDVFTVFYIEDPISTSNFFYRVITISESEGRYNSPQGKRCFAGLLTRINASAFIYDTVDIDENVLMQILNLSKKYQNYLNAYTFFAHNPYLWPKFEWPLCQKGGLQSSIIGDNPFNSLEKFIFAVGPMANERFFCDAYKLGNPTLSFPWHFHTDVIFGEQTALDKETHVFAKTLRLPVKRLPFKMD